MTDRYELGIAIVAAYLALELRPPKPDQLLRLVDFGMQDHPRSLQFYRAVSLLKEKTTWPMMT